MEASDVEKPTASEETHRLQMSFGQKAPNEFISILKMLPHPEGGGGGGKWGGLCVHVA